MECPRCNSDNTKKSGVRYNKNGTKIQIHYCNECRRKFSVTIDQEVDEEITADEEIIIANVRLAKQKQKLQDSNRIERKAFRNDSRIENAIEEYAKAITQQNKLFANELSKINVPKIVDNGAERFGVLILADLHGNELIDIPGNKYDFNVMSARLKRHADECIRIFEAQNIKSILVANVGDILNNDSILDKVMNQATNRAKASVLTAYLLTQFIMHLRQHFKINIISVMGNESRLKEKWHSSDSVVSDNYDYSIFSNLQQKFKFANVDGITFGDIDKMETVVNICNQNVLFAHDVGKVTSSQKGVQSKIGSYHLKGIDIDYMISGHLHSTNITSISARSSSMCGSNSYNEHALGLTGRASQLCLVFGEGYRNTIDIDLQNVDMDNCYDVIEELESYDAKSLEKSKDTTVIFKVVI